MDQKRPFLFTDGSSYFKFSAITGSHGLKQFLGYAAIVVVGMFTVNYWLTDKLELREPLVGCWPVLDPIIGFCL